MSVKNIVVFVYDFPHRKSLSGMQIIKNSDFENIFIVSQPWIKLNYRNSNFKKFNFLQKSQIKDIYKVNLPRSLKYMDRLAMISSVENRVPFLDHRLVDRIAGVSFDWKMGETFKSSLKKAFAEILPKDILQREKMGFPVPISYDLWIKKNLELFN